MWNQDSYMNKLIGPLEVSNSTYGGHGGGNIIDETNTSEGMSFKVVPSEWDIVCQHGGMKRWEASKKGSSETKFPGIVWGNTECECLYGGAGSTCGGCATDDYCYEQKRLLGETIDPGASIKCNKNVSWHSQDEHVQMNCLPVHNGCTTDDFANDTVLLLLNDYIDGLVRFRLDITKDGIAGDLLKPVDHFGYRQTLASPHLFKMETGSGVCAYSKTRCEDYVTRPKSGLDKMYLTSRWEKDAMCNAWECTNLNVSCAPDEPWSRWSDVCTGFLAPLFKGPVTLVCNDVATGVIPPVNTDFSNSPYSCALWVDNDEIAFQMDCNHQGRCVEKDTNHTTPPPAPAPSWQTEHHGYCNKHKSWCYFVLYALIFGGPALAVMILAIIISFMPIAFIRHRVNGRSCCCKWCSPWYQEVEGDEGYVELRETEREREELSAENQKRDRSMTNDIESQDSTDVRNDLKIPFLVSSEDEETKKNEESKTSSSLMVMKEGDASWLHVHDLSFTLPKELLRLKSSRERILRDVNLAFGPGLTGILGPSGSGKTSMLDIIAGRKTLGKITGSVRLNGNVLSMEARREQIGYVTQEDVLQPSATVREVFGFHAAMRMNHRASEIERLNAVNRMMATLRLTNSADTRIGSVSHKGISGGEKRRVSIGTCVLF